MLRVFAHVGLDALFQIFIVYIQVHLEAWFQFHLHFGCGLERALFVVWLLVHTVLFHLVLLNVLAHRVFV